MALLRRLWSPKKCSAMSSVWFQKEITVKPKKKGCHLITQEIERVEGLSTIKVGLCHVLIKHTSASLTLNENCDSDVRVDMEMMLDKLVPRSTPFRHTCEGPDDMPAHVKASLMGCDVNIPITDGKLNLGTWQGVWMCEHRDHPSARRLVVTIQGMSK